VALSHATGTHGVLPAECSPRNLSSTLVESGSNTIGVSFSSQSTGAGQSVKIVRLYLPEGRCGPTNTPLLVARPLPSPFTACFGFTRHRWPLLSWDLVAFQGTSPINTGYKNHYSHVLYLRMQAAVGCTSELLVSISQSSLRRKRSTLIGFVPFYTSSCTNSKLNDSKCEGSGACQFAYTIASKKDAMDCPQTGLPLQSFENSYGYLYLSPGG